MNPLGFQVASYKVDNDTVAAPPEPPPLPTDLSAQQMPAEFQNADASVPSDNASAHSDAAAPATGQKSPSQNEVSSQ